MRRPLIGITMDTHEPREAYYQLHAGYTTSIERAGGLPLAIPYRSDLSLIPQYVDLFDAFLFTGGDDLDPVLYGDAPYHPKASPIDPARQKFELALLAEVERRRKPALAICLGCQLLNVYRGGSLSQFLPDLPRANPIEHRKLGDEPPRHSVSVEEDSVLGRTVGKHELLANTYHKQAIDRLGRGLRVVATAPDGVVEAIEDASMPLMLAVQWHPERLFDEEDHLKLFRLLVDRARGLTAISIRCNEQELG